jgi:hypothetical protein
MQATIKALRGIALAGLTTLGACSQLGSVGNVLGGVLGQGGGTGSAGEIAGEVRGIDTQRQYLQVTTSDGRTGNVMFDNNTVVVYQNQRYSVTSLERGDYVAMRVQQDQQGNLYTDQIVVQRDVRAGTSNGGVYNGGTGNGVYNGGSVGTGFQRAEGTVGQVDASRGVFELRTTYGQSLIVAMPYNVAAGDRDTFNRLRTGAYVRVEGTMTAQNQLQLSRFVR